MCLPSIGHETENALVRNVRERNSIQTLSGITLA